MSYADWYVPLRVQLKARRPGREYRLGPEWGIVRLPAGL